MPVARNAQRARRKTKPPPSTQPFAEQLDAARAIALRLLSRRERSEAELRLRLRTRGFDGDVIELLLERLRETGLQSDDRFAERFAEAAGTRGVAARKIQADLRARGLDAERAAAASAEAPEVEAARARALAERWLRQMDGLPKEVRLRRVMGRLARRGFDHEECARAARSAADALEVRENLDPRSGPDIR
ncbi:MAG TPA: regulatory protein RecX [Actinomycetota bacterium]